MKLLFADESGNFDFSTKGSNYFVVVTVSMDDWDVGKQLMELRHRLAMTEAEVKDDGFHATEDKQAVRNEVFSLIAAADLSIDAVVLDKRKTLPQIAANESYFYQLAWHFLLKYALKKYWFSGEDLLLVASSLGTKARKKSFQNAFEKTAKQHVHGTDVWPRFWPASSHPCLQVADYCAWAIQRWKERDDDRSWKLIEHRVSSCFEPFRRSTKLFY